MNNNDMMEDLSGRDSTVVLLLLATANVASISKKF